jgi:hypothetical protein
MLTYNGDVFFVMYKPDCCMLYSLCVGLAFWRVGSYPIRVYNTALCNKVEFGLY